MNTLDDFEREITRIEAAAAALPAGHDPLLDHPDPSQFETTADYRAAPPAPYIGSGILAQELVSLSQQMRSMLWHDRRGMCALAERADASAERIASQSGGMINSRLPRHGSTALDATGSYRTGGNY